METESALVVPVPAAARLVEPLRAELDSSAALGVPAHITVLYPFVLPALIDEELTSLLTDLFASVAPFRFRLASVEWFGTDVLWPAGGEQVAELPDRVQALAVRQR